MATIRRLRRIGLRGMLVFVIVVVLVTGRDPEKLGDSFQIALPVLALGCALADGSAVRLVGRFVLLEVFVRTPKLTLGRHPINLRPNGGDQGFPSGHTAEAVFGTTALVQSCLKNAPSAQALAILAGGFVGASRIEAGKHNIWHVLAGAIVGWLAQALALAAFDRLFARGWGAIRRGIARVAGRGRSGAASVATLGALIAMPPGGTEAQVALDLYTGIRLPHIRGSAAAIRPGSAASVFWPGGTAIRSPCRRITGCGQFCGATTGLDISPISTTPSFMPMSQRLGLRAPATASKCWNLPTG